MTMHTVTEEWFECAAGVVQAMGLPVLSNRQWLAQVEEERDQGEES